MFTTSSPPSNYPIKDFDRLLPYHSRKIIGYVALAEAHVTSSTYNECNLTTRARNSAIQISLEIDIERARGRPSCIAPKVKVAKYGDSTAQQRCAGISGVIHEPRSVTSDRQAKPTRARARTVPGPYGRRTTRRKNNTVSMSDL